MPTESAIDIIIIFHRLKLIESGSDLKCLYPFCKSACLAVSRLSREKADGGLYRLCFKTTISVTSFLAPIGAGTRLIKVPPEGGKLVPAWDETVFLGLKKAQGIGNNHLLPDPWVLNTESSFWYMSRPLNI